MDGALTSLCRKEGAGLLAREDFPSLSSPVDSESDPSAAVACNGFVILSGRAAGCEYAEILRLCSRIWLGGEEARRCSNELSDWRYCP